MSDDIKRNSDLEALTASENATYIASRIKFQLGQTTLQERLQAIQAWVGGAAAMSDMTGMSASGIKGWIGRGSQPGILAMADLSRKSGLSLDYIGTGEPRVSADFDCEEARFNAIVSGLRTGALGTQMRWEGGEVVDELRAAIRAARAAATKGYTNERRPEAETAVATSAEIYLDHDLLRLVIETVEGALQSQGRNIAPANKAELILLAYSIMLDEETKQQGTDKIIRLARLAG
jgi:hypothetical protein